MFFYKGTAGKDPELLSGTAEYNKGAKGGMRKTSVTAHQIPCISFEQLFRFPAFILIVNRICDCFIILLGCGINGDGVGEPKRAGAGAD